MASLVAVIGWDIGGANTKAAFLRMENGHVEETRTAIGYFPMWRDFEKLGSMLSLLYERVSENADVDGVGLTMTAELSDAYQTKREGVAHVLKCAEEAFAGLPVHVLDVNGTLRSVEAARLDPLKVAAANWVATGWLVAHLARTCVVVDVGSTSTSIIPIINGRISAVGKTDLEKLIAGELVYTGSLRTNVAAIVHSVLLRNSKVRISSELFAQSGDVHLILGNICEEDYSTETADGRGKTRKKALARLSRIVCADTEILCENEIEEIAKYVYERQVEQVADGLREVYSRVKSLTDSTVPVVVTGLGRTFLAGIAARKVGVDEVIELEKLCLGDAFVYRMPQNPLACNGIVMASPAFGVALMVADKLEGRLV
ncbi:H4MPT-linked C1 transfer pathway protein [Candidatus Bathyarchaeota archaeon]|nr:H4MPT-linked C1 transfer pathway protein [Candidatus Bathyarchaeota archaeon]